MSKPETAEPSADDITMAGMTLGDASRGEITISDGEIECSRCNAEMAVGDQVYWRGSEREYDPFCGPCVVSEANATRAICDALERGELDP